MSKLDLQFLYCFAKSLAGKDLPGLSDLETHITLHRGKLLVNYNLNIVLFGLRVHEYQKVEKLHN